MLGNHVCALLPAAALAGLAIVENSLKFFTLHGFNGLTWPTVVDGAKVGRLQLETGLGLLGWTGCAFGPKTVYHIARKQRSGTGAGPILALLSVVVLFARPDLPGKQDGLEEL